MWKIRLVVLIGCVMITAAPVWAQDIKDLKPGKYEITVKAEMPGMPGAMPPQTMTQCLTEKNPVPNGAAGAQGCKIKNMKTEGNTVTYTMTCQQQGMAIDTSGTITYSGDTFEGTSQTKMGPAAGGMTITTYIKGKRIGKCD